MFQKERLVEHFNEHWHFYMELARILDAFIVSGIWPSFIAGGNGISPNTRWSRFNFLSFTSLLNVLALAGTVATGDLPRAAKNVVFLLLTVPYHVDDVTQGYQDRAGTRRSNAAAVR